MKKDIKYNVLLIMITVITFFTFAAMYFLDNKYTYPYSDNKYTGESSVIYLVNGWEIYEDKLLTPKDFAYGQLVPHKLAYIGQYTGFEFGNKTKNPHGSATYRINIKLPPSPEEYTLELPEIFSSYYLYVNGVLKTSVGNTSPNHYEDLTQNKTAVFRATDNVEIILGVTDFSRIYSGLIYPPAFGTKVTELLNFRLFLRSMFIFIPFSVGTIYLALGILVKEKKYTVYFFLMCIFFIGYTCYPIFHTFFATSIQPWYTIESFCYFAFIYNIVRLHGIICSTHSKVWNLFHGMSVSMCIISLLYPSLIIKDNLGYMHAYSFIIEMYKYSVVIYLIISSFIASKKGNISARALLAGFLVFGYSLLADRMLPMFEPIRFGWFTEIAGFTMICIIGGIICTDSINTYKQNAILRENINNTEKLLDMQKEYYLAIKSRIEESKKTSHDFRQNILLIRSYAEKGSNNKLIEFIDRYVESFKGMPDILLCKNDAINSILSYYIKIGEKDQIRIDIHINLPEKLPYSDSDLCVIFGNLLENAVEACRRINSDRYIILRAKKINNSIVIAVDNSFDGNACSYGKTFLSLKRNGQEGIGLSSIRSVANKYEGDASFEADCKNKIFKASVVLNNI